MPSKRTSNHLETNEIDLFYKLYFSLIGFTNEKLKIDESLGVLDGSPKKVDAESILPIKKALWSNPNIIDDYLHEHGEGLSNEDQAIITDWKEKFIDDRLFLIKHLTNYSVFLNSIANEGYLYGVIGINDPFSEKFPSSILPVMMDITLLPFKGHIIYDSLLVPYNVRFGSGIRGNLKEDYRRTKEKRGIITQL